jgi:cation transport ATPase
VLIAEVLEGMTVGRGRRAVKDLLDLLPREALVRRDGEARAVSLEEVGVGDVVVVKPGARAPVDGVVTRGHSFVDQAAITGESLPVEKVAGARVYAGTINQSGALEARVEGLGRDTAFGKIIEAVERAEKSRAPIQKTADQLAGYLVYFAISCAALTLLVTRDVRATISVVMIGNDLLKFVETLKIAQQCRRIITTNFVGTLIVDGVGVCLAAFGFLTPLLAAFIHVASELAFILNSARLLPGAIAPDQDSDSRRRAASA